MQNIALHLRQFARLEFLSGQLRLKSTLSKLALILLAALFGFAALAMLNVAAFIGLSDSLGLVWGALVTALVQGTVAVALLMVAKASKPAKEVQLIEKLRRETRAQIDDDIAFATHQIDQVRAGIRRFDLTRSIPAISALAAWLVPGRS